MADQISRLGKICGGISFELSYRRGIRWDEDLGWLDWSGDGNVRSHNPPEIRIAFTGNTKVLREAGCIDDRMWTTMQRSSPRTNRGHCGMDAQRQQWSRSRQPTPDDPDVITVNRRAKAPDSSWPTHLPAVTEILRADILKQVRRQLAEEERAKAPSHRVEAMVATIYRDIDPRLAELIGLWKEIGDAALKDKVVRAVEVTIAGDRVLTDHSDLRGAVVPFMPKRRESPPNSHSEPPRIA